VGHASSVLPKQLKQALVDVTSFKLSKSLYSRSVLFKRTNNSGYDFSNVLDRRIYQTRFPTTSVFFFPFYIFRVTLTFPSTLNILLLFVTKHITSLPVSCLLH